MSTVIINDQAYLKKGYLISTDQNLLQFDTIYHYLNTQSYWAKGISKEQLKTAIQSSVCFGLYHQNQQIGFARVISDHSTFAYLADVFILEPYRKQGLSKWLVQSILAYPTFNDLRRWLLATADAQELYAKFGFKVLSQPERMMQILNPYRSKE
jgi:N-acetylglutamate synthase-like GNAT family acetyltransferase